MSEILRGKGWVVVLKRRGDNTRHVALNGAGMPAVFRRRPEALRFRDELAAHGLTRGVAKRVRYVIEED